MVRVQHLPCRAVVERQRRLAAAAAVCRECSLARRNVAQDPVWSVLRTQEGEEGGVLEHAQLSGLPCRRGRPVDGGVQVQVLAREFAPEVVERRVVGVAAGVLGRCAERLGEADAGVCADERGEKEHEEGRWEVHCVGERRLLRCGCELVERGSYMYMRFVVAGFGRMGLGWNVGGCGEGGGKVRRVGKEGRKEGRRKEGVAGCKRNGKEDQCAWWIWIWISEGHAEEEKRMEL